MINRMCLVAVVVSGLLFSVCTSAKADSPYTGLLWNKIENAYYAQLYANPYSDRGFKHVENAAGHLIFNWFDERTPYASARDELWLSAWNSLWEGSPAWVDSYDAYLVAVNAYNTWKP